MFNKETEYALRAFVYIQMQNNMDKRPGIEEISREIGAPRFFTAKILQRLVRMGFLLSVKGKGGGFYFKKDEKELSVKELIRATEGDKVVTGCLFGLKNCSTENPCPLHDNYTVIRESINNLVSSETIQSLARKYKKGFNILQTDLK
jgi:Rrf2 family protein